MNNFNLVKFLAENKLQEAIELISLYPENPDEVAQKVADHFTETDDLNLIYSVKPGSLKMTSQGAYFDLDTKAGPNTPGEDWEDENGFGIDYYLGDYAGGSFVIQSEEGLDDDFFVIRNMANKNAKVGSVTPEGEVKIISAADSRAAIDMEDDERNPGMFIDDEEWEREMGRMEESKEEKKSNKMTREEIKEMIRQEILSELAQDINEDSDVDFGNSDVGLSKMYGDFYEDMEPSMNEADLEENETDKIEKAIKAKKIDPKAVEAAAKKAAAGDSTELAVLMATGMNFAKLEEDARTDAEEEGYKDGMKDEKADLKGEDGEVTDTEKVDIAVKEPIANEPTLTADEKAIQGHLDQALKLAQGLDDANAEKLIQQIGNTVTFFTRDFVVKEGENKAEKKAHYKGAVKDDEDHIKALEKDKEADEKELKKLDESMFPLFKKIIK